MKRILIAAALAATVAGGAQAQTTWRFSSYIPLGHPVNTGIIVEWGKKLEAATEGRVKLQIVPALGAPTAHFDLVRNGVADVAMPVANYTPNRLKLQGAAELPFTSDYALPTSVAMQRAHDRFFAKANEWQGVRLAGIWTHGPAHLYTVSKQINSLADMKGMKIRTAGGISDEVGLRMGATPFFAPVNQAYDVLSKGIADGLFFPHESVASFRLETVLKRGVIVPGGLYRSVHAMIINEAKLAALSPRDRAAVEATLGEPLARTAGEVWDRIDANGLEVMKKAGMQFDTASPALMNELRTRLADLTEAWYADAEKKNVDGKAALTFIRQTIQEVEAEMKKRS